MAAKKKKRKAKKSVRRRSAKKTAARRPAKKKPHPKKKPQRRKLSARKPLRNISPALISALTEGIGYTVGSDVVGAALSRKKKKKNPRRKVKRSPQYGIATGSRQRPRLIVAGPKAKIHALARALRSGFGRNTNIMVGRVKRKGDR